MYQQQYDSNSNNDYYNNYSYPSWYNTTQTNGYYGFCNEYPQQISPSTLGTSSTNQSFNDWSKIKQNYSWSNYYNNSTNQSFISGSTNQSFNNSISDYSFTNTTSNNSDVSYYQNSLPIQSSPTYAQKPLEIVLVKSLFFN